MDSLARADTANVVDLAFPSAAERRSRGRPPKPKPTRKPVDRARFQSIATALKAIPSDERGKPGRNGAKDKARALLGRDRSLSGTAIVIGVYLIDQLWWADGLCNRSLTRIASECNLCRSTVTRALNELEAAGHIVRIRQASAKGDWDHTIYTLATLEEAWHEVRRGVGSNKSGGRFQQFTPDEEGQVPTNAGGGCEIEPLPSAPPSEDNDEGSARARAAIEADAVHSFLMGTGPALELDIAQEQFETFRRLADTFGRRKGSMIIRPINRTESDPILWGLVRDELGLYPPEVARHALSAALRDATTVAETQDGSAVRGRGGLPSLNRYLEKVLRAKADDLVRAQKASEAKDRTEQAVHQAKLDERLKGVRGGARPSHAGSNAVMAEAFGDHS